MKPAPPAGKVSTTCRKCFYQYEIDGKQLGTLMTCPLCQSKFYSTPSPPKQAKPAKGYTKKSPASGAATPSAPDASKHKMAESSKIFTEESSIQELKSGKKKKILVVVISVVGILVLLFLLRNAFFPSSYFEDKPDSNIAFKAAQDFIREKCDIPNISTVGFTTKYIMGAANAKNRTYNLSTTINIILPGQKKPAQKMINVNMKYLGKDKWEFIGYSMDMSSEE